MVARFVSYYHDLGAEMVLIYHDGPADHLAALNDARTRIIACDDAFWDRMGGRPPGLEERQAAVFANGTAHCETDWVLLCDGDEFVFGDRPVEQFLDWVPETVDSVRLRTAEAVWGPGDDVDTPSAAPGSGCPGRTSVSGSSAGASSTGARAGSSARGWSRMSPASSS